MHPFNEVRFRVISWAEGMMNRQKLANLGEHFRRKLGTIIRVDEQRESETWEILVPEAFHDGFGRYSP